MHALPVILLVAMAAFGADLKTPKTDARSGTNSGETLTAVFFGTNQVMGVDELRTNAIHALNRKGYSVTNWDRCAVNVQVAGKEPGCAVLFWDLPAKMRYQVFFDGRGQVLHVSGGKMRHGGPAPGEPRPQMPEGGVRVKP